MSILRKQVLIPTSSEPWPKALKAAASGETVSYPIPPEAAVYRRVAICRVGDWHPSGVQGVWHATADVLKRLASSYDPFFFPAQVNCDHSGWWGPVEGLILSLEFDGAVLYADLAIFNAWLAREIDAGQWPTRSIEWWEEAILGEPFYGREDKADYLTGLGLLGNTWPAVTDLGPMPQREPDASDALPQPEPVILYPIVSPMAAQAIAARALRLVPNSPQEEPPMGNNPQEKPGSPPGSTDNGAQVAQELAAARQDNEQLRKELAAEREDKRQAACKARLEELKASGHATPAQLTLLEAAAQDPAQQASFETAVSVLAAGMPQVPKGEAAPADGKEPPEESRGAQAGVARSAEAAKVKAYQREHNCSHQEAYEAVMAGGLSNG